MVSFWRVFRIIFVIFSLYLFSVEILLWSSFNYSIAVSELLPNFALITILWSIVAVAVTLVIWFALRSVQWFSQYTSKINQFPSFLGFFIVLGAITWLGKKLMWPYEQTSLQIKLIVFLPVFSLAIVLSWLLHDKIEEWIGYVQKQITIWVWIFGIWVLFSIPVVFYYTWIISSEQMTTEEYTQASVEKSAPNIILVTFDSLTARDMSLYGYHRETTPFIEKWAEKASVFTNVKASGCFTPVTTKSLMTGKRPWTYQRYQDKFMVFNSDIENLPLMLKKAGYYNMAFVANFYASIVVKHMMKSFVVTPNESNFVEPSSFNGLIKKHIRNLFIFKIKAREWTYYRDFIINKILPTSSALSNFSNTEFPPQKVFDMFMTEIDKNIKGPYFAWLHLAPPRFPYLAPKEYHGLFDESRKFRSYKSQRNLTRLKYFTKDQQVDADILRARYDEFIRYCDAQFKDFIGRLKEKGQLENSIIILSADHGESFENGLFNHGGPCLYEQEVHIPLIIKEPGQIEGKSFDILVGQVDISATILDLVEMPRPSWMEGKSLKPLIRGKKINSRPVFSMQLYNKLTADNKITGIFGVWKGDYKLKHYPEDGISLLYNVRNDPNERENLFEKELDVGNNLLTLIQDNLRQANQKILENQKR